MNDHVATVRNIYEAFGKGDIPAILDLMADEVQWEQWEDHSAQKAGVPWLMPRKGKASVPGFFQVLSSFQWREFQVLSLMANESQVAAEVRIELDIPASGVHLQDEEMHLWTFDAAGKVIRFRHYLDTAKHIAAAQYGQESA